MRYRKKSNEEKIKEVEYLKKYGFELDSHPRFFHQDIDYYLANEEDMGMEFAEEFSTFDFGGYNLEMIAYIMFKKGVECGKRIKEEKIKEVLNI